MESICLTNPAEHDNAVNIIRNNGGTNVSSPEGRNAVIRFNCTQAQLSNIHSELTRNGIGFHIGV